MFLLIVGTLYNQFSSRVAVNRKVHFVLDCCIEPFRCCKGFVIVYRSGINICDFLIEQEPSVCSLSEYAFLIWAPIVRTSTP